MRKQNKEGDIEIDPNEIFRFSKVTKFGPSPDKNGGGGGSSSRTGSKNATGTNKLSLNNINSASGVKGVDN